MSIFTFIDKIFQKEAKLDSRSYRNYQNRDDFYQNLFREDTLERLSLLFQNQNSATQDNTLSVCFRNIPFNCDEKQVINRLGKPRYQIDNEDKITGHKVFFYRTGLYHFRAICQLHFLHNHFFLGKYTFRNTSPDHINNVLSVLQQKYFSSTPCDNKLSRIKDREGNAILLEKSLHLNVCYVSGNPQYPQLIQNIADQKRTASEQRQARSLKALENYL
jgi:hypothetical protein